MKVLFSELRCRSKLFSRSLISDFRNCQLHDSREWRESSIKRYHHQLWFLWIFHPIHLSCDFHATWRMSSTESSDFSAMLLSSFLCCVPHNFPSIFQRSLSINKKSGDYFSNSGLQSPCNFFMYFVLDGYCMGCKLLAISVFSIEIFIRFKSKLMLLDAYGKWEVSSSTKISSFFFIKFILYLFEKKMCF